MRRIIILSSGGFAAIVLAMLYVSNGSADTFAWTYQECVHYQSEASTPAPVRFREVVGHPLRVLICDRWESRVRSWVFMWLVESALALAFIALAASLTRPGMARR